MKSKKGMYNYFVLTFGVVLLVVAFVTLFTQIETLSFNTLGSRSDFLLKQTVEQDILHLRLDECAKRAANQAVINLILSHKPSDRIHYHYNENVMNSIFIDEFYKLFKQEIETEGLPFEFEKQAISIKDGDTIFGFGRRFNNEQDLEHGENYLAKLNISYIPRFSYTFQNYNLRDFQKVYRMMNDFVLTNISGCSKEIENWREDLSDYRSLLNCVLKNYSEIPLVDIFRTLDLKFDGQCISQFDDYFSEFSERQDLYIVRAHSEKYITVCLKDNTRLISGLSKESFIVEEPIYLFFIEKDKISSIGRQNVDIRLPGTLNPMIDLSRPIDLPFGNTIR